MSKFTNYSAGNCILITANPLVALFFACNSKPEKNGEVFIIKMNAIDSYDYEGIDALASIGFFNHLYPVDFKEYLENVGVELKLSVNMHSSNYDGLHEIARRPILIRQKTFFERQKAQSGRYILFFNNIA
jgi:hypothetical protein